MDYPSHQPAAVIRWENDNQIQAGVVTAPTKQRGTSSGFVDISKIEPLATHLGSNRKSFLFFFMHCIHAASCAQVHMHRHRRKYSIIM